LEIACDRSVQLVGEPVFIDINDEAMARLGVLRCFAYQCCVGATLLVEALGLISIVDKNVGIDLGDSFENGWSSVLTVVNANKYIFKP
jgi:hypothetical protein